MPLPANRVAVIVHVAAVWATALAAFIAAIAGTFPQGWQDTALAIGALFGGAAGSAPVVLKFLDGAQKWEQQTLRQALPTTVTSGPQVTGTVTTIPPPGPVITPTVTPIPPPTTAAAPTAGTTISPPGTTPAPTAGTAATP